MSIEVLQRTVPRHNDLNLGAMTSPAAFRMSHFQDSISSLVVFLSNESSSLLSRRFHLCRKTSFDLHGALLSTHIAKQRMCFTAKRMMDRRSRKPARIPVPKWRNSYDDYYGKSVLVHVVPVFILFIAVDEHKHKRRPRLH